MIKKPAPIKNPNIQRKSFRTWLKGTVSAYDDGRTPTDGLKASGNAVLDQDGTVRPRPSLVRYGTQPTGTILGEIFEFVKANGSVNENYLITVQNVAGTASVYVAKDGGAWTICTGKTYDTSAKVHYCQIDNKILIMNGVDNLSYLDIPTLAVTAFTPLAAASAPTVTPVAGLVGAGFNYYYAISANSSFGNTAATATVVTAGGVTTQRDLWTPATQYVTVSWSAVSGAKSYNVYIAETSTSTAYLIASGVNGTTFKDDGTTAYSTDVSQPAPLADTTAGVKATRGSVVNGQVFLYGVSGDIRTIYAGGTGTSVLDFSPFGGGGTTEIGRGTKEVPVKVVPFRNGTGSPKITVLCQGTNGTGKRYTMTPDSVTYGSTVIPFFNVQEENGQDGTDSPDGVILYNDSLWYPSRDGFKTTGTKPQLQNILSTDTVSETIITDVKNLNSKYMSGVVGLAYQQRLYWAVPNGSTTNNEIWVLDLARGGAWMKPWSIACSWMVLYNDNSGYSHHLILKNNVIFELTYAQSTYDDGTAFPVNITSGLINFSEDTLEWAKVIDITFVILRPQGVINFLVSGKTEDASLASVGSSTFTQNTSVAGWGEAGWGGSPDAVLPRTPKIYGWSNFSVVPVAFGDSQRLVSIEIDEELEWLQWEIDTTDGNVSFQLADVVIRSVPIGVKSLD